MTKNDWKVYVYCVTYNQSEFIRKTLDGFCMQQTNFPFVCTIIDDASTDGESELIAQYLEEQFNICDTKISRRDETGDYVRIFAQHNTNKNCFFATVFLKYNHGQKKKTKIQYITEWKDNSKYAAICEGDDYWIDPLKLQKQVDYMESHPNCSLCYTSAKGYYQESHTFSAVNLGEPYESYETLLKKNVIPTLTILYRQEVLNGYVKEMKPMNYTWSVSDYPQWLWLAAHGDVHFFSEITGVYRLMSGSLSHPTSADKYKKLLNDANDIAILFDQKFNQGKLTKYREHLRYRGLMSVEADYNHSLNGVFECFKKMPQKTINDVTFLCKSFFQISYYRLFKHKK